MNRMALPRLSVLLILKNFAVPALPGRPSRITYFALLKSNMVVALAPETEETAEASLLGRIIIFAPGVPW